MKLNRARKRQLRVTVRKLAATAVSNMELASEELEGLDDEELAYAKTFKADLAAGMDISEQPDLAPAE